MSETTAETAPQPQTQTPPAPVVEVPKVYFYKELLSNAFIVGGRAVPFEALDGNRGVIALDPGKDQMLIDALNEAANKHRGGIVKIPFDQYTEKKSLYPFSPSDPRLKKDVLRALPSLQRNRPHNANAPAVAGEGLGSPAPALPASQPSSSPPLAAAGPSVSTAPPFKPATRRVQRDARGVPIPAAPV